MSFCVTPLSLSLSEGRSQKGPERAGLLATASYPYGDEFTSKEIVTNNPRPTGIHNSKKIGKAKAIGSNMCHPYLYLEIQGS